MTRKAVNTNVSPNTLTSLKQSNFKQSDKILWNLTLMVELTHADLSNSYNWKQQTKTTGATFPYFIAHWGTGKGNSTSVKGWISEFCHFLSFKANYGNSSVSQAVCIQVGWVEGMWLKSIKGKKSYECNGEGQPMPYTSEELKLKW